MKILGIIIFLIVILLIAQISFAQNVEYVGSCVIQGSAIDVFASGNYAYVATINSGVRIIDISNPTSPWLAGYYQNSGCTWNVFGSGQYLFVAADAGLQILNVADPTNPYLVGFRHNIGQAFAVYVSGYYAYVSASIDGLEIIDISDPSHPVLTGACGDSLNGALSVYVYGNYAYLGNDLHGFRVIDISDPTNPSLAGFYNWPDISWGVFVYGDNAYVAAELSGILIINISNPYQPTLRHRYNTPGYAHDIHVIGNYAFVGDHDSGLQVIDISDPTNPIFAGSYDTPGNSWGIYASKEYIFIADEDSLQILRFNPTGIADDSQIPNEFSLSQNYPNPFNAQTSISYSLPKSGPVNLSIYNLIGQKVVTLSDGILQAGEHNIIWDAKDFSSGVYFARLESGDQTKNIKMILLK